MTGVWVSAPGPQLFQLLMFLFPASMHSLVIGRTLNAAYGGLNDLCTGLQVLQCLLFALGEILLLPLTIRSTLRTSRPALGRLSLDWRVGLRHCDTNGQHGNHDPRHVLSHFYLPG